MKEKLSLWSVASLIISGVLFLDVLTLLVFLITDSNQLYDPVAGIVTALLALIGIAAYLLVKRRGVPKFVRRILLAATACCVTVIVLFCAAIVLLFLSL